MATSITNSTTNPLVVAAGQTLSAFSGVQVADTIGTTETVSITLGYNYYSYYSPNADFGSISDPNGGGQYDPATHTFTESGLVTGDPTFATQLLRRLIYTPPALPQGQAATVIASVTVANSGDIPQTDPKSITIQTISAPLISGTVANAPVSGTPGSTIRPFATTYVTDANFDYTAKNIATIKITDGGALTDADGLLTGPGLSKTPGTVGTYTLSNPDYAWTIGNDLQNLVFAVSPVAVGQTRATAFELDVTDPKANLTTTDTTTSITAIGPAPGTPPIVAGTLAGQTVTAGNVIRPFASVTVSDANPGPKDVVAISLLDSAGNISDKTGTLSGFGLTETASGSGIYTLASNDPAVVTAQLNALTFTPAALPAGQAPVTTQFKLVVSDAGQTVVDNTTTVTEIAPTPPPKANFLISDQSTGLITPVGGEPYSGPVQGITQEIILATSDNINVVSEIPNVFIHTGSGNDSINVSGSNGNNILDGFTGSNFLVGGTGTDNFYLDARNPAARIFSTIVNFHSGDNATVWGINAADFSVFELDNEGADGFKGLDFVFTSPGHVDTSFVLTGYTSADLNNGRLSVSYGKTADDPNAPGSDYFGVHAN
jgi:hypothetical protein